MFRFLLLVVLYLKIQIGVTQIRIVAVDKATLVGVEGVALHVQDSLHKDQMLALSNEAGVIEVAYDKFPSVFFTSHVGYNPYKLEVAAPGVYRVELEPSLTKLEGVVITGQVEPTSIRQSVYKVRVLDEQRIKSQGTTKLQDVLSTELNVRFTNDPALGVATISMQGLPGQNVKVLINGVPVIGRQGTSNAIDLNQINVNSIERIEIVEGPMSTMYGADAIAGVINIITKKPDQNKISGSVRLHEETVGKEYSFFKEGIHQENVSLGYKSKSVYTLADFGHYYSGGWKGDSTDRDKQWHPKSQWLGSGTIGIQKDHWNVSYRLDYLNEDLFDPANFSGVEALDHHYITNRFMHQVQGAGTISEKLSFTGALAYTDYSRRTQTIVVNKNTGEETLALSGQDLTSYNGITIRGALQYKLSNKISLQPGYDINLESGSGGRLKEGRNSIEDYAFFVSAEIKPLAFLSIRPGIRLIKNSVYQAPPIVPSINAKFEISSKHDVRLSYGRGFRAPSLRELYFNFFDSSHSLEGNPTLEAELSHSFNASWNWYAVKGSQISYTSTVSGFYNSIDNMIGYGIKPTDKTITTYINIDKYKTEGVTWNNSIQANALRLAFGFGYTGRYNQLASSDTSLPDFTWSPEITSSVSYSLEKIGMTASLYYKYTGKTPFYETDNGLVHLAEADSYNWADLTVQKTLLKRFSASLGVRNLFNVTSVNSTSLSGGTHTGNGANSLGCGRSYFGTIIINFVQ